MYSENGECRTRSVGQEAADDYGESTTESIYLQTSPRYGCLPTDDTRDITKCYTTAPQSKFLYQSLQKTSPPDGKLHWLINKIFLTTILSFYFNSSCIYIDSPHLPLWHHYDVTYDHETFDTNSSTMTPSHPLYTSTNSSGVRDRMSYHMRNAIPNNEYCFMTAGRLHNGGHY